VAPDQNVAVPLSTVAAVGTEAESASVFQPPGIFSSQHAKIAFVTAMVLYVIVMSLAAAACTAPWVTYLYGSSNSFVGALFSVTVYLDHVVVCSPTGCSSLPLVAISGTITTDKVPLLRIIHVFSAISAAIAAAVCIQMICVLIRETAYFASLAPIRQWLLKNRNNRCAQYVSLERTTSACTSASFFALLMFVILIKPGDFNPNSTVTSSYSVVSGGAFEAGVKEMSSCAAMSFVASLVALITQHSRGTRCSCCVSGMSHPQQSHVFPAAASATEAPSN
jgi:hypothetical protein